MPIFRMASNQDYDLKINNFDVGTKKSWPGFGKTGESMDLWRYFHSV